MSHMQQTCSNCDAPALAPLTYSNHFKHGHSSIQVDGLTCLVCAKCGTEIITPEQVRANHRVIADAKRKADGLLTGDEIRAIRERLALTQQQAALVFGGGANAFSKYECGDVIQSVGMDRLMRVTAHFPLILAFLKLQAGMPGALQLNTNYGDGTPVSLNDPHYTSRTISTPAQVIQTESWKDAA